MIGGGNEKREANALIIVLILSFVLMILGVGLSHFISNSVKGLHYENIEFSNFESADGGIYAVAGWMYFYKRVDVPREVTHTVSYDVDIDVLKDTVRYPAGYSSSWKGFDVKLDSVANSTEVEAVVFVPVAPVGYGNE